MKYIILIHSNEQSRKLWDTLTEQQRIDFGRGHVKLTEEMAEAGELVVSEGLADPALARWVSARDGETIASDPAPASSGGTGGTAGGRTAGAVFDLQ